MEIAAAEATATQARANKEADDKAAMRRALEDVDGAHLRAGQAKAWADLSLPLKMPQNWRPPVGWKPGDPISLAIPPPGMHRCLHVQD